MAEGPVEVSVDLFCAHRVQVAVYGHSIKIFHRYSLEGGGGGGKKTDDKMME